MRGPRVEVLAFTTCAALWAAGPAAAAGRIEVTYDAAAKFADAGTNTRAREQTERELRAHFERLGDQLPDGQVLRVQVHDVDLAGTVDMRSPNHIRVLGTAPLDGPRIDLHYELRAGDQTLASGDDKLSDSNYKARGGPLGSQTGSLPYERRLIENWFTAKVQPVAR